MSHEPKPIRSGPNWVCAACGERVGRYASRTRATHHWRHVTKGPDIVYGKKARRVAS